MNKIWHIKQLFGTPLPLLGALLSVVLIAGCGSSGESSKIGVGEENPNAAAEAAKQESSASATASAATASANTIKTPTSGPLSKSRQSRRPQGRHPPPS